MDIDPDDLKQRLASLEGQYVTQGKDSWPVGDWSIEALAYMEMLENIIRQQHYQLRHSCRPMRMGT